MDKDDLMKASIARTRIAVWLVALTISTMISVSIAGAGTTSEVDLEGATRITQIFIVIGAIVMAVGVGIYYTRNKKS